MQDVHTTVLEAFQSVKPFDDIEKEDIEDAINWIKSGAQIFRIQKPDRPPKHLVTYFVVVDKERKAVLLADHIKAQLWLPNGGHVAPNESPTDTVEREVLEELGIKAVYLDGDSTPIFVTEAETVGLTAGHVDVCLWYLLACNTTANLKYDKSEFKSVRWFSFEEVLQTPIQKLNPDLHRFIRKLLKVKYNQ